MAVDLEPQDVCDQVLQVIRSSQLNFCSQETPYSVFLTLRKSFTQKFKHPSSLEPFLQPKLVKNSNLEMEVHLKALKEEIKKIKMENFKLEHEKVTLINKYEEEISFNEQFRTEYKQLESAHEILNKSYQNLRTEKNFLESKHQKVSLEQKALKSENDDLQKEVRNINVALKSAKKEMKDASYKQEQKSNYQEERINELLEYKKVKVSEEKTFKNKQKKLETKVNKVLEKEAAAEIKMKSALAKEADFKQLNKHSMNGDDNQNNSVPLKPTALAHSSVHHTNLLDPTRLKECSLNDNSLDPHIMAPTTLELNSTQSLASLAWISPDHRSSPTWTLPS